MPWACAPSNCILLAFVLLFRRRAADDRRRKKGVPSMRRNDEYLVVRKSDLYQSHVIHSQARTSSESNYGYTMIEWRRGFV